VIFFRGLSSSSIAMRFSSPYRAVLTVQPHLAFLPWRVILRKFSEIPK
jgi:hypothetical protein